MAMAARARWAHRRGARRYYEMTRDFLKAAIEVWGEAWGSPNYMVTRPVTLKAMVRVCADLAVHDAEPAEGRVPRWRERLQPWSAQVRTFRAEAFYERFPARGQIERVTRPARSRLTRRGKTGLLRPGLHGTGKTIVGRTDDSA
jgi:hypothetical protein